MAEDAAVVDVAGCVRDFDTGLPEMIRDLTKLLNRKYVFRSAETGEFVSRAYALLHPATTYATLRKPRIEPMERF